MCELCVLRTGPRVVSPSAMNYEQVARKLLLQQQGQTVRSAQCAVPLLPVPISTLSYLRTLGPAATVTYSRRQKQKQTKREC
jgi:hypothetical protein